VSDLFNLNLIIAVTCHYWSLLCSAPVGVSRRFANLLKKILKSSSFLEGL